MIIKSDLIDKYRGKLKYDFLPKKTRSGVISFLNYRLIIELKVNLKECSNGDIEGFRWIPVDEFILGNDYNYVEKAASAIFNNWLSLKGYNECGVNEFISKRFLEVK